LVYIYIQIYIYICIYIYKCIYKYIYIYIYFWDYIDDTYLNVKCVCTHVCLCVCTMGATRFEFDSLHDVDHQPADARGPLRANWQPHTHTNQHTHTNTHTLVLKVCWCWRLWGRGMTSPRYAFSLFFFSVSMKSSEAALIFWTHAVLHTHTHTHARTQTHTQTQTHRLVLFTASP